MNQSNPQRLTRLILTIASLWAGTAAAVPVSASIDGLPPGLSTRIVASKISCNPLPPRIERFAAVPMVENNVVVYDYVLGLNGVPLLRPRTVTSYSANMNISTGGCTGGFTAVQFSVDVEGESTFGSLTFRNAGVFSSPATDDPIRVVGTLRGFSHRLFLGSVPNLAPFVQLTRGLFNRVSFSHVDPFGAASVAAPVLEFVLPSPTAPRGFATSTRLFVKGDGQKCIRAQFITRCQTTGVLSHGGVDLSTDSTEHRSGSSSSASSSTFVFRLSNSFPAGTYTLNASADDVDPFDYLVDGVPTSLDLLKWTPATQSVVVQ